MQHSKALRFIIYSIATRWRRAYYIIADVLCYPRNRHYSTYSHYASSHSSYYPVFRWFRPRRRIKCVYGHISNASVCGNTHTHTHTHHGQVPRFTQRKIYLSICVARDTRCEVALSRASHLFSRLRIILRVSLGATTLTCGTRNIGSGSPRRIMCLTAKEVALQRKRDRRHVDRPLEKEDRGKTHKGMVDKGSRYARTP
jgi:hypothetical protein